MIHDTQSVHITQKQDGRKSNDSTYTTYTNYYTTRSQMAEIA